MDIPVFHLDFLNNRVLIAVIAILHVVINHAMAVGGIPLVVYLERRAIKSRDEAWDELAYRILKVFFISTTTVGALTGVGIWFSASLVNPYAIGSLLRVFFWTWFTEWMIFVTEVALILAYYLTWKKLSHPRKLAHLRLGRVLAVASWLTMSLIVSILSFMMDPGAWRTNKTLFSGMLNPVYGPQLAFRTPLAMVMAGVAALCITASVTKRGSDLRAQAVQALSRWVLAWIPLCVLGGYWYARAIPASMTGNVPVALLTQALAAWSRTALQVLAGASALVAVIAAWGALRPATLRTPALVVSAALTLGLVGTFERVREFIRKPYAIADYLYSNGIRKADYPLLQRDGLLAHATYTRVRTINADNHVDAGREVFILACTRCHTVDGVNGVKGLLQAMYGNDAHWDPSAIAGFIGIMHTARPFMPPFPGSMLERAALGEYLASLQFHSDPIDGAQVSGVQAPAFAPPANLAAVAAQP